MRTRQVALAGLNVLNVCYLAGVVEGGILLYTCLAYFLVSERA